jgi:sugar/nucleoside kinase (ribokinase family)
MGEQLDLVAIGLTTLDITVYPVAALPDGEDSQIVEKIALSPAGTAGGTALVAAKLGLRAAVASAVGDDPQGKLLRTSFADAGVETDLLAVDRTWPTSTTVLPVRPNGDRPNFHMLGASVFAPLTEQARAAMNGAYAVHWGAVAFPGVGTQGADALGEARAKGAFITCDLIAPSPEANADLERLLPHVDLFLPSLAEVKAMAGTDNPVEAARLFMRKGAKACLVKLGGDGALLVLHDRQIHAPAHAITPVDTTSCGDSLCAGYIAARRRGMSEEDALRFAVATAAQVALGVGTLGQLGGFEETLSFMQGTPLRDTNA